MTSEYFFYSIQNVEILLFQTRSITAFLQTEAWSSEYDIPQCDKVQYLHNVSLWHDYDTNVNSKTWLSRERLLQCAPTRSLLTSPCRIWLRGEIFWTRNFAGLPPLLSFCTLVPVKKRQILERKIMFYFAPQHILHMYHLQYLFNRTLVAGATSGRTQPAGAKTMTRKTRWILNKTSVDCKMQMVSRWI